MQSLAKGSLGEYWTWPGAFGRPLVMRKIAKLWDRWRRSRERPESRGLEIATLGGMRVAYRLNSADESVIGHSFQNDIFFAGVPEYVPNASDVILDVGAHIGTFALLASTKVPQGQVYALEPCRETYNLLEINIALNRARNVRPVKLALSDRMGETTLYYAKSGNWGNSTVRKEASGETVGTTSLKRLFDQEGIDRVSFAKFNCEGAEFAAILSAEDEVIKRVDRFLVLYHEDMSPELHHESICEKLVRCGFKVDLRNQSAKRGWILACRV